MSNEDSFRDRLEDLFAYDEAPRSESNEKAKTPRSDTDGDERWIEEKLSSLDLSSLEEIRERVGWEDFLNAIDRNERIGFSFDGGVVTAVGESTDGDADTDDKLLEAPLQIGDEILGALQLAGDEELPEEASELLTSIAQQVTQHIENLRLLAQAEQYRAEAEQATRRLTHEGWQDYMQSAIAPKPGYFYDRNQMRLIDTLAAGEKSGDEAVNVVDLLVRGQPIGQITVAGAKDDSQKSAEIISTVANRLSAHVENLRLLDETELSRQQLDKRATELETVAQVSTAAATILDPEALLQSVVYLTQYSFGLYFASVFLIAEDNATLTFQAGPGEIGEQMIAEKSTLKLGQKKSVVAQAARSREVVIVNDASKDPAFMHQPLLPDTLSEMALPMIVADELIGIFDVHDVNTNRFSEDDIRTFSTLASQIAVALRNAQLYAEQMETVQRLRELDELKSSFLANMSHELRTPLNSIIGFTQVIMEGLDGPVTKEMETDLQSIHGSGQHLLSLINDVLDMAKIEAGKFALTFDEILLAELLEGVLQTVHPLAAEKSLFIEYDSKTGDDIILRADSVRIRQILINLIGNAIKFTDEGGVTIETEKTKNNILISVKDTGLGIPQDNLVSVFEAFSQIDTSTTRKAGGTGLGLPISHRLVEMHGGRIWAESNGVPGEGSVFRLELPIKPIEEVADDDATK